MSLGYGWDSNLRSLNDGANAFFFIIIISLLIWAVSAYRCGNSECLSEFISNFQLQFPKLESHLLKQQNTITDEQVLLFAEAHFSKLSSVLIMKQVI